MDTPPAGMPEPRETAAPPQPGLRDLMAVYLARLALGAMLGWWAGEDGGARTLLAALVMALATLGLVGWFGCARHGTGPVQGLALHRVSRRMAAASVAVALLLAGLAMLAAAFFVEGRSAAYKMATGDATRRLWFAMALLLPFCEEIYYRGFIYPVLRRAAGVPAAICIAAAWFTADHAAQLAGDWAALPVILLLGITLTVLRERSGSTLAPTISHFVYNATLIAIGITAG